MVKSDRTILFFSGLNLEFEAFEHIAGLVSDSSHKTAIEFGVSLSDNSIGELVQSGFVESLGFHSNVNAFLTGLITQYNCFFQVFISNDFGSDCYPHNIPLQHNLFKHIIMLFLYENQENKARCL